MHIASVFVHSCLNQTKPLLKSLLTLFLPGGLDLTFKNVIIYGVGTVLLSVLILHYAITFKIDLF